MVSNISSLRITSLDIAGHILKTMTITSNDRSFDCPTVLFSDIFTLLFLPSANEVAERLCFYTCLSFCSQGGVQAQAHGGCLPGGSRPRPGGCLGPGPGVEGVYPERRYSPELLLTVLTSRCDFAEGSPPGLMVCTTQERLKIGTLYT